MFSDPGTADEAMHKGTYGRWWKIVNDPRFVLQRQKRNAAARGVPKPDGFLPLGDTISTGKVNRLEMCLQCSWTSWPAASPELRSIRSRNAANAGTTDPSGHRVGGRRDGHEDNALHKDWSEDMGSGATTGLGMYPAKYSFNINSANCGNASQPDFVVYNTSLTGLSTQASIVAYDNLYSGCSGTTPSTYWAYDTGGTVVTSVVLSMDGSQVAFAQSSTGGSASLVLLKWKASTTESASSPGTPNRRDERSDR